MLFRSPFSEDSDGIVNYEVKASSEKGKIFVSIFDKENNEIGKSEGKRPQRQDSEEGDLKRQRRRGGR